MAPATVQFILAVPFLFSAGFACCLARLIRDPNKVVDPITAGFSVILLCGGAILLIGGARL